MEYVPCIGNSSYSFWRILLKLYRCFKDGLKICILFFQNSEINFYHFLRIFNLDIFRALILQICIWGMYLVSATPPRPSFFYFLIYKPADCIICEKQIKIKHQHYSFIIFRPAVSTVSAASEIKVSGYTPWKNVSGYTAWPETRTNLWLTIRNWK